MLRFALAGLGLFLAAPADAASATQSARERGVTVWRGPEAAAAPAVPAERPACADRIVVVTAIWPPRTLRIHGSWSGANLSFDRRLPLTTQGFFADRMAAGL